MWCPAASLWQQASLPGSTTRVRAIPRPAVPRAGRGADNLRPSGRRPADGQPLPRLRSAQPRGKDRKRPARLGGALRGGSASAARRGRPHHRGAGRSPRLLAAACRLKARGPGRASPGMDQLGPCRQRGQRIGLHRLPGDQLLLGQHRLRPVLQGTADRLRAAGSLAAKDSIGECLSRPPGLRACR